MGEVSLVVAGHPLGRLQVRDLPPDQVGEHSHWLVRLIVLLQQVRIYQDVVYLG